MRDFRSIVSIACDRDSCMEVEGADLVAACINCSGAVVTLLGLHDEPLARLTRQDTPTPRRDARKTKQEG